MWSVQDVSDGAIARASPAEVIGVFERLSREPSPAAVA
jgi:hypothetical protein